MRARRTLRCSGHRFLPCLLAAASLQACSESPPPSTRPAFAPAGDALSVDLHGAIRAAVRWEGDALDAEGMPQPDLRGARLRFSGEAAIGTERRPLSFILGIPALEKGAPGTELGTRVTLIEEGAGRFFATGDTDTCWSDVHENVRVPGSSSLYRLSGVLYCMAPLAELNGSAGVSFTDLSFTGRVDWRQPE